MRLSNASENAPTQSTWKPQADFVPMRPALQYAQINLEPLLSLRSFAWRKSSQMAQLAPREAQLASRREPLRIY
jgi:hypothetical protein